MPLVTVTGTPIVLRLSLTLTTALPTATARHADDVAVHRCRHRSRVARPCRDRADIPLTLMAPVDATASDSEVGDTVIGVDAVTVTGKLVSVLASRT